MPKNQAELVRAKVQVLWLNVICDVFKGPVEYKEYAGQGHMFIAVPSVMEDVFPSIQNFLRKYVLYGRGKIH